METQSLIALLAIGVVAGWIAEMVMPGGGFGHMGNMVVGIVGALIGVVLWGWLGISAGALTGAIGAATVGAAVLLLLVSLGHKAS